MSWEGHQPLQIRRLSNSQELWSELCDRHAVSRVSQVAVEDRSGKETELLSAITEGFLNAQHWSTRRQILCLMVDKLYLKEMREFIPTVTSYPYNIARHHSLLHGRAALYSCNAGRPSNSVMTAIGSK